MYYIVEPEVAGSLGKMTVLDSSTHPPKVSNLEFVVDCWLGDCIIESFPCFLITSEFADCIQASDITGYEIDWALISVSDDYEEYKVPNFKWLKIVGDGGKDDFGLTKDYRLIISEKVFYLLKKFGLKNADIDVL